MKLFPERDWRRLLSEEKFEGGRNLLWLLILDITCISVIKRSRILKRWNVGEAGWRKWRAGKSVLVHVHIPFKRLDSAESIIRFASLYFIDNVSTLHSKVIHAKTSVRKILAISRNLENLHRLQFFRLQDFISPLILYKCLIWRRN